MVITLAEILGIQELQVPNAETALCHVGFPGGQATCPRCQRIIKAREAIALLREQSLNEAIRAVRAQEQIDSTNRDYVCGIDEAVNAIEALK